MFDNYWELITGIISLVAGLTVAVINIVRSSKKVKSAKTQQEKDQAMNEIKSAVHGFIAVAETTFASIDKSGNSKLLYVLKEIKNLCAVGQIDYDEQYWINFINNVVALQNEVLDSKEAERVNAEFIEHIKGIVPTLIEKATRLFIAIPNNLDYKVEYVLKAIKDECAQFEIDVYDLYNWEDHVRKLFEMKEAS